MKIKFWSKDIAISLAYKFNIKLKYIHWIIIYYYRFFYFKYKILPSVRKLLIFLNEKFKNKFNKKIDSFFLYKLFPKGLIKQVCIISCLPNKTQCF